MSSVAEEKKYVMEVCELCQKPIAYSSYATDAKGERPIHMACLNEADFKQRGLIPAGKAWGELLCPRTAGETLPDEDDDGSKGHA